MNHLLKIEREENHQSNDNQYNRIEEQEVIVRLDDCMKCSVQVERYQVN